MRWAVPPKPIQLNVVWRDITFNLLLLTYFMEQSPSWKANRFSASQEIPRILCNPKIHYRIHKSLPPAPILGQINLAHAPHLTSWRSILILSFHLRLGFLTKTLYATLLRMCYMPRPSYSRFDRLNNIDGIRYTRCTILQGSWLWYWSLSGGCKS